MTDYNKLAELERKYDGPIPRDELNSALGRAIPETIDISAMAGIRARIATAARNLESAHEERQRFEVASADWDEDRWQAEDDRTMLRLRAARHTHDAALTAMARLKATGEGET